MNKAQKKIITIGRQFGSNGREIGKELSTKLGIPFYDKEILNETAKNSGLSEQLLKSLDEKPSKSSFPNLIEIFPPEIFLSSLHKDSRYSSVTRSSRFTLSPKSEDTVITLYSGMIYGIFP